METIPIELKVEILSKIYDMEELVRLSRTDRSLHEAAQLALASKRRQFQDDIRSMFSLTQEETRLKIRAVKDTHGFLDVLQTMSDEHPRMRFIRGLFFLKISRPNSTQIMHERYVAIRRRREAIFMPETMQKVVQKIRELLQHDPDAECSSFLGAVSEQAVTEPYLEVAESLLVPGVTLKEYDDQMIEHLRSFDETFVDSKDYRRELLFMAERDFSKTPARNPPYRIRDNIPNVDLVFEDPSGETLPELVSSKPRLNLKVMKEYAARLLPLQELFNEEISDRTRSVMRLVRHWAGLPSQLAVPNQICEIIWNFGRTLGQEMSYVFDEAQMDRARNEDGSMAVYYLEHTAERLRFLHERTVTLDESVNESITSVESIRNLVPHLTISDSCSVQEVKKVDIATMETIIDVLKKAIYDISFATTEILQSRFG